MEAGKPLTKHDIMCATRPTLRWGEPNPPHANSHPHAVNAEITRRSLCKCILSQLEVGTEPRSNNASLDRPHDANA